MSGITIESEVNSLNAVSRKRTAPEDETARAAQNRAKKIKTESTPVPQDIQTMMEQFTAITQDLAKQVTELCNEQARMTDTLAAKDEEIEGLKTKHLDLAKKNGELTRHYNESTRQHRRDFEVLNGSLKELRTRLVVIKKQQADAASAAQAKSAPPAPARFSSVRLGVAGPSTYKGTARPTAPRR